MGDIHDLEKKHEHLVGRVDEIKQLGLAGFQAQINQMQDRMNRQEAYIKELLLGSHNDRLSFVESLKNLEISITKLMTENIKTLEIAYRQDREKQSGFNLMVAQKLAQGAIVAAVVWFLAKDMFGGG